jgi:hypothetical protein
MVIQSDHRPNSLEMRVEGRESKIETKNDFVSEKKEAKYRNEEKCIVYSLNESAVRFYW